MTQTLLIVTGHPRSGTTMLYEVCNTHPDIFLTYEFGNFLKLMKPSHIYQKHIRNRLWPNQPHRKLPYADLTHNYIRSFFFVMSYMIVSQYYSRQERDNKAVLRKTLQTLAPRRLIVGDKYPRYTNRLDEVVVHDDVQRVMIYRDGRDVVASAMVSAQRAWKGMPWADHFRTVEAATKRWLTAIERMEQYRDRCYIVRYEELVQNPMYVLAELGNWLGIDGQGFDTRLIHADSIGRYQDRLSPSEVRRMEALAGPTLERLGYL